MFESKVWGGGKKIDLEGGYGERNLGGRAKVGMRERSFRPYISG